MSKTIKYAIAFYGGGIFCFLLGLSLNESTTKEKNIKYVLLFAGISIIGLYLGLGWKKPSSGGGVVHKYGAICIGILCGLYSIYLLMKLL
ncbi:MAG TPA: hypothetical protein VFZ33_05135 [Chitinophagaceae bacterium]